MAAPSRADALSQGGPWTEEDFLALPVDPRIELLDGSLLVSPTSGPRHQWLSSRIWAALTAAAPSDLRALEAVNVRVGRDRLLIPDLSVIAEPDMTALVADAGSVRLIVEIVSPSNAFMDRAVKPQLYAQAGIPVYLRVEMKDETPVGHLHELDGDAYRTVASGPTIALTTPFPVVLDLAVLAD